MTFSSIGDLASRMMLSQSTALAKRNMTRLSQELTSGMTSDVGRAVRNDFSSQMGWERTIASSQVREKTLTEAMGRVQAKQTVLGAISTEASSLANEIGLALTVGTGAGLDAASRHADDALANALSKLNTQFAGRTLFAGTGVDGVAVATRDEIMASVKVAVAGAVTVEDYKTAVQGWMDDLATGFQTVAYLGTSEDTAPIRLSDNRTLDEGARADHPAVSKALQNLILASLAGDDDLSLSHQTKAGLLQNSADGLRAAEGQITELHASLGFVEAEIVNAVVEAGAEIATAELLRARTLGVDQYDTASKLQEAELQLEKIYMLTARSARMSLLEYLR